MIDTPMFERLRMSCGEVEPMQVEMSGQIRIGRFGTPDEMAAAKVFLASDESSCITGVELAVSGGLGQL
jgi:NAD(P)-dependent dehydrogenase (short-subunit alcohol dehydrogenase family)